jgi:hypothetical protein
MTRPGAFIEAVGLLGPGLDNWPQAAKVLAGEACCAPQRTILPPPDGLPAAERRRTGSVIKVALAVGHEAAAASGRGAATLATVFAASGGDGQNYHAICETLAGEDRQLSPTRFHNSVHNAPAGYWSIATHAMTAANVLCAFDGSFAAGLLESFGQVCVDARPNLLIAYDTDYPEPMRRVRPIIDAFGVALVLAPEAGARTLARLELGLTHAPATVLAAPELEQLRLGNPAARALPLLEALARRRSTGVILEYLPGTQLRVDIAMCGAPAEIAQ